MHGKKLLQLAKLVGLGQSDIAREFGINRVQVHTWAQGKRPIPRATLGPLMRFIHGAVARYLAEGKGDIGTFKGFDPHGRGLTSALFDPPLRPHIEALLCECLLENMELRGVGPSATIPALAVAMEKYQTMDPESLRKPEHAEALWKLGADIQAHADMLLTLGPLFDLVAPPATDQPPPDAQEDTTHADPD